MSAAPPPFFSIFSATRNAGRAAIACIRSVAWQSFGDYEHVFIDDASDDDSVAEIAQAPLEYPRLRVIRHEERLGKVGSFLEALPQLRGTVVVELDGDDKFFDGDGLAAIARAYHSDPLVDATFGRNTRIHPGSEPSTRVVDPGRPRFEKTYCHAVAPRTCRRELLLHATIGLPDAFYEEPGLPWTSCGDIVCFEGPALHLARRVLWLDDIIVEVNNDNPYSDRRIDYERQCRVAAGVARYWIQKDADVYA